MVCITKNYLSTNIITQLMLMHSFNTTCSAYRHKDGGLNVAVVGVDNPSTSLSAGGLQIKRKTLYHVQRTIFSILARASRTAL